MEPTREGHHDPLVLRLLHPGERIELGVLAVDAELRVTDRRLLVTSEDRLRLDIGYGDLRRIQFDLEAGRPATMVIVPQRPSDEAQVLTIPFESLHRAAEILAFVGERLP
jgi:hypothetical protein